MDILSKEFDISYSYNLGITIIILYKVHYFPDFSAQTLVIVFNFFWPYTSPNSGQKSWKVSYIYSTT